MQGKVTILEYYKGFWSLYLWGAGVGFLPPLVHQLFGSSSTVASDLYPPLGDNENLWVALTVGMLLSTTLVVFVSCDLARRIRVIVPSILFFAHIPLGCGLIFLYVNFVREIPIETKGLTSTVSIGFERTEFAISTYGDEGAAAMLHDRGPWEESIETLWTLRSISIVRASLWTCYTLILCCWVAVCSLGVYRHKSEELRSKAELN